MGSSMNLICSQILAYALLFSSVVSAGPIVLINGTLVERDTGEAARRLPDFWQDDPLNAPGDIYVYAKDCSPAQTGVLATAWSDAKRLANAHNQWKPKEAFQAAQDGYLGDHSSNAPWIWGTNWVKPLTANIQRQWGIHNGKTPWLTYAFMYCDESKAHRQKFCEAGTFAYTWDSLGWIWNTHSVVLCPTFFDTAAGQNLDDQITRAKANPALQNVIDNFFDSPGASLFHESYHWARTVSIPKTNYPHDKHPEYYGAQAVWDLARSKNTEEASFNAESYLCAATAMFVQQTFNLPNPPKPKQVAGNGKRSVTDDIAKEITTNPGPPAVQVAPLPGAPPPMPQPPQPTVLAPAPGNGPRFALDSAPDGWVNPLPQPVLAARPNLSIKAGASPLIEDAKPADAPKTEADLKPEEKPDLKGWVLIQGPEAPK